jgi:molybdopterin-biosynthesis enzyme MoeA-like protein
MDKTPDPITQLLTDVILPNLKATQTSQAEQIAANKRLESAIAELRLHMEAQFAHLSAQLMACRAELAATQAILKANSARQEDDTLSPYRATRLN